MMSNTKGVGKRRKREHTKPSSKTALGIDIACPLEGIGLKVKGVAGRRRVTVDIDPHGREIRVRGGTVRWYQLVGIAAQVELYGKVGALAGNTTRECDAQVAHGLIGIEHGVVESGTGVVGVDVKTVVAAAVAGIRLEAEGFVVEGLTRCDEGRGQGRGSQSGGDSQR